MVGQFLVVFLVTLFVKSSRGVFESNMPCFGKSHQVLNRGTSMSPGWSQHRCCRTEVAVHSCPGSTSCKTILPVPVGYCSPRDLLDYNIVLSVQVSCTSRQELTSV